MKRTLLFLLAGLILTLFAVQSEARTYYTVTATRTVTAPPLYWQYYNGYYAPMAARAYYAVPPVYRPVRVYTPGYVVPQPVPVPYGYPVTPVPGYYY